MPIWLLEAWGWSAKAGAWLKRWGWLLLTGLSTLLAFVFYELWRKKEPKSEQPVRSAEKDQQVEKREAERADQELKVAEQSATQKINEARRDAADDWATAVDTADKTADVVKDNPEATDRFLGQVGDEMRRQ